MTSDSTIAAPPIHPRLAVHALCTLKWTFAQDLALWTALGVRHATLHHWKFGDDPAAMFAAVRAAGITPSTVVCDSFDLTDESGWDAVRAQHARILDLTAAAGGPSIYMLPGHSRGMGWDDALAAFARAVAPSVAHGERVGVRVAIEPLMRTDLSFVMSLADGVAVAQETGVALVADFSVVWMERDLGAVVRRALPHLALVQICDLVLGAPGVTPPWGRVHVGDGDLPVRALIRTVLDAGYDGLLDLEAIGEGIEAEGYAPALARGVAQASALLTDMGL